MSEQKVQLVHTPPTTLPDGIDPAEYSACCDYFVTRHRLTEETTGEAVTGKMVAAALGFSERTLYNRLAQWRKSDVYKIVEREFELRRWANTELAYSTVFDKWLAGAVRLSEDLVNPKTSPRTAVEIFRALHETIITPILEAKKNESDDAELYIRGGGPPAIKLLVERSRAPGPSATDQSKDQ